MAPQTNRRDMASALMMLLSPLVAAGATYLAVASEHKKKEAAAWEAYGEYVTSQLERDEAVVAGLERCQVLEGWVRAPVSRMLREAPEEQPQADVVLDRIAKRNGWRPPR